jgi:hypothetical protein
LCVLLSLVFCVFCWVWWFVCSVEFGVLCVLLSLVFCVFCWVWCFVCSVEFGVSLEMVRLIKMFERTHSGYFVWQTAVWHFFFLFGKVWKRRCFIAISFLILIYSKPLRGIRSMTTLKLNASFQYISSISVTKTWCLYIGRKSTVCKKNHASVISSCK